MFEKRLAGVAPETPLALGDFASFRAYSRARDGTLLYQASQILGGPPDLWVLPGSRAGQPVRFMETQFSEFQARLSPDERWVAYTSDRSESNEAYVTSFPRAGEEVRVSASGGTSVRWRRDGRELFFMSANHTLMAAEVDGTGAEFKIGAVRPLFDLFTGGQRYPYDVSADGQRFIVNLFSQISPQQPITVVVNWTAGLKK